MGQVVALPGAGFPELLAASVHSPGVLVEGSRNDVWLCPAYSGSRELMLFVKPRLTDRQLVTEMVCAQLGIALGLPCPQPYLVSVAPHLVGGRRGPSVVCFGSEQVGPRSMARPVRSVEKMVELLKRLKIAEGVTVFDEWIGNSVRGPGDVVFDPEGGAWLIDHEAALAPNLASDEQVANWLAARLLDGMDLPDRVRLHATLKARSKQAFRTELGRPPPDLVRIARGPELYRECIQLLRGRLEALDVLLSRRVLPEQGHLQHNSRDDSAAANESR